MASASATKPSHHPTCRIGRASDGSDKLQLSGKISFYRRQAVKLRFTAISRSLTAAAKVTQGNKDNVPVVDDDDGVSLGTMKLPPKTDIARFEVLLFQWANSLSQGANVPLPIPIKVDRIKGGARLGFVTMEDDGKVNVTVYIDCIVSPATESSGPIFRAIRNGSSKNKAPLGEPGIMRSLLLALQKSVDIASI